MMATSCARITVSGIVQGVFFRKHARDKALELGLRGYVTNLPDGRVHIIAQGLAKKLEDFIRWCHRGSPNSQVSHVEVKYMEKFPFKSFEIRS
jgi:acylphosphatase